MNLGNFQNIGMLLTYDWVLRDIARRPNTFLSEMLTFNGHQVIQIGLKNVVQQSKSPLLFLVGINLKRIGLKLHQVRVGSEEIRSDIFTEEESSTSLQLFTLELSELPRISRRQQTFKFEILVESTDDFSYTLCSSSLQNQLWEACCKGLHYPDITIETSNVSFKAHKAVLAARSEEFASHFKESDVEGYKWLNAVILRGNVSSLVIEQFLKFLYTGTLEGSFDNDYLLHLATSFGVESLVKLCQEARKKIELRDLGYLMAYINPDVEPSPAHLMSAIKGNELILENQIDILSCEWKISRKRLPRSGTMTVVSDTFCLGNSPLFAGTLHQVAQKEGNLWTQRQSIKLVFPVQKEREVTEVYCSISESYKSTWIKMDFTNHGGIVGPFKVFQASIDPGLKSPFSLSFQLQVKNKVEGLAYLMMDETWFREFGYCRRNYKQLDLVDVTITNSREQTLNAHRFLLSCRSPVFASILSESLESQTIANINVGDVSLAVMESFLQFLYTGQLNNCSSSEDRTQLQILAEKYEIDSLTKFLATFADNCCDTDNLLLSAFAM